MNTSSIGIIGGADGPTTVFVSGSPVGYAALIAVAAAAMGLILWLFMRRK